MRLIDKIKRSETFSRLREYYLVKKTIRVYHWVPFHIYRFLYIFDDQEFWIEKSQLAEEQRLEAFWKEEVSGPPERLARYHIPAQRDKFIGRLIPDGARVLDLGCGSGRLASYLQKEKGCKVVGLDFSPSAIEFCQSQGVEAYVADLDELESARMKWVLSQHWDCAVGLFVAVALKHPERLFIRLADCVDYQLHANWNAGYFLHRLRLLFGRWPYNETAGRWRTSFDRPFACVYSYTRMWTIKDFRNLCRQFNLKCELVGIAGMFAKEFNGSWRWIAPNLFAARWMFKIRKK